MMWSGIRRSSDIRLGHRPALSASKRTNGRGAAASEIAEVQIGCEAGSRLSSTRRCVIVSGSAAAGALIVDGPRTRAFPEGGQGVPFPVAPGITLVIDPERGSRTDRRAHGSMPRRSGDPARRASRQRSRPGSAQRSDRFGGQWLDDERFARSSSRWSRGRSPRRADICRRCRRRCGSADRPLGIDGGNLLGG